MTSQRKLSGLIRWGILRAILSLGLVVAVAGLAFASSLPPQPVTDDARILHLLNRLSFGPAPGDIDHVKRIGIDAYIEEQLSPGKLQDPPELDARLRQIPELNMPVAELAAMYQPPANLKDMSEDERKENRRHEQDVLRGFMLAKTLHAIESPAQLQEVMTDFWFNHFNVFADKSGEERIFVGPFERDAIRPNALGNFHDLLKATARNPAMLIYLDNWLNTDPDSPAARGKKIGINENYAREVMELHTLGVDGGYTQTDVTTLAHILTGWGLAQGAGWVPHASFAFDPRRHDATDMIFLHNEIRGGGEEEIDDVLDRLAENPATAHHIAFQLAQYFVADQPPAALVNRLAAIYIKTDGAIKPMLRTLFHAPEFWDQRYGQNKFKPPFRYIVSAARATGFIPPGDGQSLFGAMAQMGEPLYRCLTPNGYGNTSDSWLNSDALLKRVDFARALAAAAAKQGAAPAMQADKIVAAFGDNWDADAITTIKGAEPGMRPVLALSAPAFVYY